MAHMQMIPEEVETAFLKRTIKAFTWVRADDANSADCVIPYYASTTVFAFQQVDSNSDEGRKVHESVAGVLQCMLEDMRSTNTEEDDTTDNPLTPM